MYTRYDIKFDERAVLIRHGRPERALAPGRHRVFGRTEILRYAVTDLVFVAPPEVRAVLPADWYDEFVIDDDERGVLYRDGVPVRYLRPGTHRRWAIDESVRLVRFDASKVLAHPTTELMQLIPRSEITFQIVAEYEGAALFVAGRFERELEPGLYAFWTRAASPIAINKLDLRTQLVTIAGQDLMTRDKVTLRLTLSAEYRVVDVRRAVLGHAAVQDAVYLRAQLAARSFVAGVKLDELLEGRRALEEHLADALSADAEALGIELQRIGVKDVVLPGDMKLLLNRVIEAEKEAAAKVILRREEVAGMRSLAQSAKVLEESPGAMRLKELEALKEMATSVGEVRLVMGSTDGLQSIGKLLER